jgi:hypothetical protein
MPDGGDVSLLKPLDPRDIFRWNKLLAAILAKRLSVNVFSLAFPDPGRGWESG